MATQGWAWARAARRRFDAAAVPPPMFVDSIDRNTEVGQGIEALDRAFRYADWILESVAGLSLPAGPDWSVIRRFARRGRDALAHGDERLLADPGYSVSINRGVVRQFGKARQEREWRTEELPIADLIESVDHLSEWFIGDASDAREPRGPSRT